MDVVRITANHFCAGIIVRDGYVIGFAPILKYMQGWSFSRVMSYCNLKGWKIERIKSI